jgi:cell wall assembly regulator SMI1
MTGPPLLDAGLLDELEGLLREQTADALSGLREQRACPEELDEAERSLSLRIPDEARLWWAWWNPEPAIEVVPNVEIVSLHTAVAMYRVRSDLARSAAEQARQRGVAGLGDPHMWWRPNWLPLLGPFQHDTVAIDCDVPADAATPVLRITATSIGDKGYDDPRAPSMGALVAHWIQLLRAGAYVYDRARKAWNFYPADKSLWADGGSS